MPSKMKTIPVPSIPELLVKIYDLSMTLSTIAFCDNTQEPAKYGDFELRTPKELADEALELLDKELPLCALGTFAHKMSHCFGYKEEMAAKYPRP